MGSVTAVVVVGALLALSGCERWELDRKMEELCKKDGGVKVYETVTLPASEFSNTGEPLAKYIPIAKTSEDYLGPDYRYVRESQILVGKDATSENGKGQLARWHTAIYRKSDGHLLGESVSYERGGGDWITLGFQPGGNACPLPRVGLSQVVFVKGE